MAITLELPQKIEQQLQAEWNGNLQRRVLEAVAVEGYRCGTLSRGQVSELLSLSFYETEIFLKEREAYAPYRLEDVTQGSTALASLLKK